MAAIEIPLSVTAKADTAADARKEALVSGERKAFYAALAKIAPTQARDIYRKLRGKDLSQYLDSLTVTREVQRAGSYEADVTYRVNEESIKQFIEQEKGIFAGTDEEAPPQGAGLLIIPPYDAGNELLLWERENLWRAILNNVALEVGQGTLVMPFGDPRDISILEDEVIFSGDKQALSTMAKRYGTRNVVIALARSRQEGGKYLVEVTLRKAGAKASEEVTMQYKASDTAETLDMLLTRAARDSAEQLVNASQSFSLFGVKEADKVKPIVMRLEYNTGKQWRDMLGTLETLPGLSSLDIGAVGVNAAEATIFYKGSESMISRSLVTRGFSVDDSKKYWVVRQGS